MENQPEQQTRKGSKRKATKKGQTSADKQPRTSAARSFLERIQQEPIQEAQQPQAEEINSPEPTDGEDETSREDDDSILRIRALPTILIKAIKQLSPAQQQCVKDIGLGRLLDLNITNLPRKMGLWLVENFDPRSCTLQLQNGQTVHITADDVAATLGLPMGHIQINKRTARLMPEILKEWRLIFDKTTAYITPKALTRKMLEVDAADPWFKRHFALLVMSVLIDPMVNGYVNQNYIDHLQDVGNIANLNWCQMVINALINSKLVWVKSTDKIYGGPILFLTVFYVDRVVLYKRIVPRSIPAFKTWTFRLLLKRERAEIQSGGFGYGHIDSALQLENAPPGEENASIPQSEVPHPPQPQGENPPMPEGLKVNTYLQTLSWCISVCTVVLFNTMLRIFKNLDLYQIIQQSLNN